MENGLLRSFFLSSCHRAWIDGARRQFEFLMRVSQRWQEICVGDTVSQGLEAHIVTSHGHSFEHDNLACTRSHLESGMLGGYRVGFAQSRHDYIDIFINDKLSPDNLENLAEHTNAYRS